ncbi:hypothetical protein ACIBCA_04460 [Kitasatospora sp. NPDC051170]|uniref:hypothetical protein n=1 Tax=Kitasatospora sp. NPDC051170 TaxID=3364056 RepID=UPI0037A2393E
MPQHDAWKVLSAGDRPEVVLAVDFDVTGRPEARFTDLAPMLKADTGLWESLPPAAGTETGMTGEAYLDRWHRGLGAELPEVRAVFGYCVGGVYAAELAARIARTQERSPLVVLFDPEPSTGPTLFWQFHKVMEFMRSVATDEEIAAAQEAGRIAEESTTDLGVLSERLIELFRRTGEVAFARAGLDGIRRAELFATFSSFMTYLSAAGRYDALARWSSAVAITSVSPTSGLNGIRAHLPAGEHRLVAREIRVEVEHAELLRSDAVASVVDDLLLELS